MYTPEFFHIKLPMPLDDAAAIFMEHQEAANEHVKRVHHSLSRTVCYCRCALCVNVAQIIMSQHDVAIVERYLQDHLTPALTPFVLSPEDKWRLADASDKIVGLFNSLFDQTHGVRKENNDE